MTDDFASALNFVAADRAAEVDDHLATRDGVVARLDGRAVTDRDSLFRQLGEDVLGQPVQNWGQVEDLLRLAVTRAPGQEYALVWTDAHRMLDGGLPEFVTVADICYGLARSRSSHQHRFRAFFLGDGPNFR